MPTASKSGPRSGTRCNWRDNDRPRSRPGPRSQPRRNPFSELAAGLRALIRFHEAHPDWFPPVSGGVGSALPAALDPKWEAAIQRAYGRAGAGDPAAEPHSITLSASNGEGRVRCRDFIFPHC